MKFALPLSAKSQKKLDELRLSSPSARVRVRAHAILLSARGYPINEIATIFSADRKTVSSWIDSWESEGFEGIADKPRSGRPQVLTAEEAQRAIELIKENPRSVKVVLYKLRKETGKTVSIWTLKRLAKKADLRWKRIKKSVKSKRDDQEFEKAKKELKALKKRQKRGEIDLFYFDESSFCLEPSIPYAWQPQGEHIEVPTQKGSCFNVLGFLREDNRICPFLFKDSVNSDVVIACFDEFSKSVEKKTVVVIDNAPPHTSNKFKGKIGQWEKSGLFIKTLPTYCPELNLIEILWRFIKYFWMPFSAYKSFKALIAAVEGILGGVGSKYQVNFA